MESSVTRQPDNREPGVVRFARRFFYGCVAITVLSAFAANATHRLAGPREWTDLDGLAMLVLLPSFLTSLIIPFVWITIVAFATGRRRAVLAYAGFGLLLWYFQLAALAFDFAQ